MLGKLVQIGGLPMYVRRTTFGFTVTLVQEEDVRVSADFVLTGGRVELLGADAGLLMVFGGGQIGRERLAAALQAALKVEQPEPGDVRSAPAALPPRGRLVTVPLLGAVLVRPTRFGLRVENASGFTDLDHEGRILGAADAHLRPFGGYPDGLGRLRQALASVLR